MSKNKIINITIPTDSKHSILEKIKKGISNNQGFCHIVSLNPENLIIAHKDEVFKKIVETAQIKIIDGQGIVLAGQILGIDIGERYPGVDLMSDLVKEADKMRLRLLLIGGQSNLALRLAQCYNDQMLQAKFRGLTGIQNIKNPQIEEEKEIFSIVTDYRPHIVFVSFGSPDQEKWIDCHAAQFKNCVVMGVGGAFDFLSGKINRAPVILRRLGLEWFYRLVCQPWRWRRQLRLVRFLLLVMKEKLNIPGRGGQTNLSK